MMRLVWRDNPNCASRLESKPVTELTGIRNAVQYRDESFETKQTVPCLQAGITVCLKAFGAY